MEDQPLRRSRRLQNLPLLTTVEPPLPPLRRRINTSGSFESIGISENPRELELRYIHLDLMSIEIKDFQTENVARNYNSPTTDSIV